MIPDGGAESGNKVGGGFRPVLLEGLFLRVEEKGTKPVLAGAQTRGEGDGHGVGGQYVEGAPFDERGDLKMSEELVHPCRYVLGSLAPRRPGACCRKTEQIGPLDIVEVQDARE